MVLGFLSLFGLDEGRLLGDPVAHPHGPAAANTTLNPAPRDDAGQSPAEQPVDDAGGESR